MTLTGVIIVEQKSSLSHWQECAHTRVALSTNSTVELDNVQYRNRTRYALNRTTCSARTLERVRVPKLMRRCIFINLDAQLAGKLLSLFSLLDSGEQRPPAVINHATVLASC